MTSVVLKTSLAEVLVDCEKWVLPEGEEVASLMGFKKVKLSQL